MSTYKLTYFNVSALGEPIRFILSYAGINFEDNRIAHEDWPKLKSSTPLGQLPILEIDGKVFFQSNAIVRYLARKFNLNGSNDVEAYEVDAAIETITDLRQTLAKWFFYTTDEARKAAAKDETLKKAAFYLNILNTAVEQNGGYLVGGKLTAADFQFAGMSNLFSHIMEKDAVSDYPNLKNLVEKVVSQPGVKSYIEKRPKADF